MRAREEREIKITMSPKELRDLADKMEAMYKKLVCGQSTFVDHLNCSPELTISLYLDQDYFEKAKSCKLCEEQKGFGPSHDGSKSCESESIASGGNRSHCTCDTCF